MQFIECSRVFGKTFLHQPPYLTGDIVLRLLRHIWDVAWTRFGKSLTVVLVVIPLTTNGLLTVFEQDVVLLAQFPIPEFHAQLWAFTRPFAEGLRGG